MTFALMVTVLELAYIVLDDVNAVLVEVLVIVEDPWEYIEIQHNTNTIYSTV